MSRHTRLLFLAAALLTPMAAAAQSPKPVCELVSEADAAAVIGSVEQTQAFLGPDHCIFTAKGISLIVNRLRDQEPEQVDGMLQLPKNRAREGDEVKDEPGIGQRAVSEMSKGHLLILAASGNTVWSFGVDTVYRTDISATLPKLRDLAKKVVGP